VKAAFRRPIGIILFLALVLGVEAGAAEWQLAFEDAFDRQALGTDWLILRGDWHINAKGQLQIQRQWTSHSHILCTVPLRGRNARAEFELTIPSEQAGRFGFNLQAGALGWGGGGIDDRVGLEVVGAPAGKAGVTADDSAPRITTDEVHRVVLEIEDGRYDVRVDGRSLRSGVVAQGRSLVNSGLQLSACPGGVVDNLRLYASPMSRPLRPVNDAPAEENRRATVVAETHLDSSKPDCGFQDAIDSLPPGGGVVVLPRGEFALRRFLEIRSHTTLTGQGRDTVLRAMDATGAVIQSASSEGGAHRLTLKGPHDFRKGDAFCYGGTWSHPAHPRTPGGNRLLVLDVQGDVLTVTAPPPKDVPRSIAHFFPVVCSYESEFAEVRDLAIQGPAKNPAGCAGRFMTNPVTFGSTSHPRFTRLFINGWPGDGISAQACDDGRLFDNTIQAAAQGMHPGTTTLRTMVARNFSMENPVGLYFCWYNNNGIYYRNRLRNFSGYPDSGDNFNTLAFNWLADAATVTVGYNGCLFGNRIPRLQVSVPGESAGPGGTTYSVPARYFTIGANRVGELAVVWGARGNVIAANTTENGAPTPFVLLADKDKPAAERPEGNIVANDVTLALPDLPTSVARSGPEPPIVLPAPVLDGRDFYRPDAPDASFQSALDRLAGTGGSLQLPAGRYALSRPLRVPSRVVLAGYGAATVLLPAGGAPSLVLVSGSDGATVRDLALEGDWARDATRGPAVRVESATRASLIALDVRGWAGHGIAIQGGGEAVVRDCRALRCTGTGYRFESVAGITCETSSAVLCGAGFEVEASPAARLLGNISALHGRSGFRIASDGAVVMGCNANTCREDGILVENAQDVLLAGNTCVGNNQSGGRFAGIGIGPGASAVRVVLNNCGDEQLYATQLVGIREDPGARRSEVRFNVTATLCTRRGREGSPSLVAEGGGSAVEANWTETILPSNDSLESIEWLRTHPKTK
jgi:hypothetical protein